MFKKIVSNLTFSPALIGQLSFYAKRLKKENATRRLAMIFTALAILIQSLAVFNPPESSNAASANDMVYGGIGQSLDNFLKPYDANTLKIRDVMNYAGITREEIINTEFSSWKAGEKLSWGFVPHFSYEEGERQHTILDDKGLFSTTIYSRPLGLWKGSNNTVYGWVGQSKKIGWFAIMQVCGNLVTDTIPSKIIKEEPIIIEEIEETIVIPQEPIEEKQPIVISGGSDTSPKKCEYNNQILSNDPSCKPCPGDESIWINDAKCKPNIVKSKKAINTSQNFINSSESIAKPGEQIRYSISINNNGLNETKYIIEDNLSDILEYSEILDNGGGSLDPKTKTIRWDEVLLPPQGMRTRTYTVRILNSIPAIAQGKSNSTSYDCIMTNTFGNSINTKIECPIIKSVEAVASELPTTGPGDNIIFSCVIIFLATYFFARSSLLEKEIQIIRKDSAIGTI